MENLDTNELIEGYLDGSLPPAEQQAIEARLATDATFRAEIELHRQLHAELADAQKLRLRDMLSDIVQEAPPATPTNYGWVKGLGLALVALLAIWLGWRWLSPTAEPAIPQEIKSSPIPSEPGSSPQSPDTPSVPQEKLRPIAMADPKDFLPNRDFEARLGSNIRASGGSAEMQSPALGAGFVPKDGFVKINFRGTAPADADTARYPLALKIYANQPIDNQPSFQVLPAITNRSSQPATWTFSSAQRLYLKPGLYYFTIERQAEEDLIFVGKFTVGAKGSIK